MVCDAAELPSRTIGSVVGTYASLGAVQELYNALTWWQVHLPPHALSSASMGASARRQDNLIHPSDSQ